MPELTAIHFGLLALALLLGAGLAWMLRGDRCAKEKIAVNASWQDQLESQQSEHNRLAEQNKSLMQQISQYQASQKDYSNRAKELSDSLKEAFSRRDDLQRQLKEMRGKLEVAVAQRNQARTAAASSQSSAMKEKDDKIFHLSRELTSWQNRVPPLVERFQERDKEARTLEDELGRVLARLQSLEEMVKSDQTRIEPMNTDSLPHGGDASNEPIAVTSIGDDQTLQDQILEPAALNEVFDADLAASEAVDVTAGDDEFADVFASEDAEADPHETPPEQQESEEEGATSGDEPLSGTYVGNGIARDDLQMIKGIGPSIEKTLHDLGIVAFHQIAEMSEVDIDRVAQQLRGFRSRIYREDWIGQARDLQYQKDNGKL